MVLANHEADKASGAGEGARGLEGHARVADRLVEVLERRGIDRVFGIPGGTISPVYDALVDSSIEVVVGTHETMAVYAAYGYARATGKPGVVLVTSGPGILNAVTAMAAACADEVPILLLGGEVSTASFGRGVLQDGGFSGGDMVGTLRAHTKHSDRLQQPSRARALFEEALDCCVSHPMGPCFLALPVDLSKAPLPSYAVHGARPVPAVPPAHAMDEMGEILARAAQPVLWLGLAARTARLSGREIRELAAAYRMPVISDIEGRGVLAEDDAHHLGCVGVGARGPATSWLQSADVVLTLGARLDDTTTLGFSLLEGKRLLQIDHDRRRLARSVVPEIAVACDLREAVRALRERAKVDALDLLSRDRRIRNARAHQADRVLDMGEGTQWVVGIGVSGGFFSQFSNKTALYSGLQT